MELDKVEIGRPERNRFAVIVNGEYAGSFSLQESSDGVYAQSDHDLADNDNVAIRIAVHNFVLETRAGGDPKHLAFNQLNDGLIDVVIGGKSKGSLCRIDAELWQASDLLDGWLDEQYPSRIIRQLTLATLKDDIERAVMAL